MPCLCKYKGCISEKTCKPFRANFNFAGLSPHYCKNPQKKRYD